MPSSKADLDVVIVGGGPAGAATALALRHLDPGMRVALVERSAYAAFRVGETLPPPARRLLEVLRAWDSFDGCGAAESYGTRAAWGGATAQDHAFVFSPFGRGWHVDRRRFDAWLAAEAEQAGALVCRDTAVETPERRGDGWTLTIVDAAGSKREIEARFIVDATGRHSRIARAMGARHLAFDRLTGVAARLRVDRGRAPFDTYTEVEACRDGWWYTAMLPDGHLMAMFMTDVDLLRRTEWRTPEGWRALASDAPLTARRLAEGIIVDEPFACPAGSQRLDVCAGPGWLAVGDAACTVDPLSSQGVMRALRSGLNGARALHLHAGGDRDALVSHSARLVHEYDAYLGIRNAYYTVEQRWPQSPFWRRRHSPVTATGAAHAIHVAYQHHEEPATGQARRLHV